MKKLGYFLARNTTNILALYFVGWAVWAGMNWDVINQVQKLIMGMFLLLILHEYEEGYKEHFIAVMGRAWGIQPEQLPVPGLVHVPADSFIAILFTLALLFPNTMWLVFPVFILGIFEMIVHNWGIYMFQLKSVTPGWYSAILQGALSIYALVVINKTIDYAGIQWLWATLYYVSAFIIMEIFTLRTTGMTNRKIIGNARSFLKNRFGKSK